MTRAREKKEKAARAICEGGKAEKQHNQKERLATHRNIHTNSNNRTVSGNSYSLKRNLAIFTPGYSL